MKNKKTCKLVIEVDYNSKMTDPEGLAAALDMLLETALSTPELLDDYGNPEFGGATVLDEDPACYFLCRCCGGLDHATTSDVKTVGPPICGDCDEEMIEITQAEYIRRQAGER